MHQNMSPLNVQINLYTLSIINTGLMESNVAQKCKIDNKSSNINHICTTFKVTTMLITEV